MTKEMTEKKNKNKKINKMTKITMTITMQHLLSMLSLLVVQQCSLVVESFQPRNILPSSSVVTAGTTVPLSSSLLRLNAEPPSSKSSSLRLKQSSQRIHCCLGASSLIAKRGA